jgi:hypothetical protein
MTETKMFRFGSINYQIEFFIEQDIRVTLPSHFEVGPMINRPVSRQEGVGREDILQTLADYHVKVVTFPPHMTNFFQCLDLSLFSVLKKKMNSQLPLGSDDSVVAFIRRIFHDPKQTLTPDIVRSAFVHIGVEYDIDAEPCLLIFDESVLRQSSGFLAIWQCDYPLEQLSPRRQRARFGWVNQDKRIEWNE